MVKKLKRIISGLLITCLFASAIPMVFAQDDIPDATFAGRCAAIDEDSEYPPCADSPNACGTHLTKLKEPFNCIFLEEPIGGRTNYDLYKYHCLQETNEDGIRPCFYEIWSGESIIESAGERGPLQAILSYEEGKPPFALLYNYLRVVYNFLSGLIIAFVIFVTIIGGVMITTAGSTEERATQGRKLIIDSLIGATIWFLASLILYTINPTFFTF